MTIVFLSISFCAVSQDDSPKPPVSDEPLTTEQIAVYRVVLKNYLKGWDGALNLANMTEPFDQLGKACLKGMRLGHATIPPMTHKLEPSLVSNTKIVLVDPERQEAAIKDNDPQNLMKKAMDGHDKVTEQLDESLKQAFQSGLFTLSEIVFDREHHRAAVAYRFVCGMLCGNGNTVVLKKEGQDWKVTKKCFGYVS